MTTTTTHWDREQRQWIIEWLSTHVEASCVNTEFHDSFFARFGGKRSQKMWGAEPVDKASRLLSSMANEGLLTVRRIALGNGLGPGFPSSVLSYSLERRADA